MNYHSDTEKVLQCLREKKIKSGGHCGSYFIEVRNKTGFSTQELKNILNQLFIDQKISVKPGFHGKLIFLKEKINGTSKNT